MNQKTETDYKQKLKRQRIKTYFLDATKKMIIEEGVESVSVRKVADVAGYSYATLYNYFDDLNELLWDVKQAMINDIVDFMQEKVAGMTFDIQGIKSVFKIYMRYYLNNPNIFKFFYFHELSQPVKKRDDISEQPDFEAMMRVTFKNLVDEGKLRETDVEVVGKTCIYAVHGMLTLFFSGNGESTQEYLFQELDRMIDYLL